MIRKSLFVISQKTAQAASIISLMALSDKFDVPLVDP